MTVNITGCLLWRPLYPYLVRPSIQRSLSALDRRPYSSSQESQTRKSAKRSNCIPASGSKHDWMGPPDRLSNLRPIVYHIPENETELEKQLRHLRQETEDWNHEFWAVQNVTFNKERDAFIVSQLTAKGLSERDAQGRKRSLNSEEMAVFYKNFLDTNRIKHANYNKEWYRRNFTITMLMGRVALTRCWSNLTERGNNNTKDKKTPTT